MAKIFLTGGTGFFGKSILDMLNKGFAPDKEFVILSRNPQKFLNDNPEYASLPNVRFVRGDVRDFSFPAGNFDCIIHAATPAVLTLAPGEMRSIIMDGTERVLQFAKTCGVRRLLFTSSGAVYGPQPPDCHNVPEDFPCNPVTEYGIAKLEAERMCIASGIPTLIARCFAFAGPRLNKNIHFAIGNFIRDCEAGKEIVIQGDGTPFRSYMHADDLVEWLFAIMERGEPARPYNVGSPEGISIADLAKTVASCFPGTPQIRILGTPVPGAAPARYVPDVSRIQNELQVTVKKSLIDSIKDMII